MTSIPVPAPPAATVVLLRDGAAGVEAYLQRRVTRLVFGGLWVFPGGSVDVVDASPELDAHWAGPSPEDWAARLDLPVDEARGIVAAACRETLEEAGVLLADRPLPVADVAAARAALLARQSLVDVVAGLGVRLATDLLRYWAFWVTPEAEPRRWSARFFIAKLPDGVPVAAHEPEADGERWVPVAAALDDPELNMLPPTRHTLATIGEHASVAEVLDAGRDRRVERYLPRIEDDHIVLPWDERVPVPPEVPLR